MSGLLITWLGALVSLGVGLVAGLVGAFFTPRGLQDNVTSQQDTAADLSERLAHCIAQLRDLDEQRHRLTADGYAAAKAEFEARAATLLRAQQAHSTQGAKKAVSQRPDNVSPAMRWLDARPQLRGALWGGGTVAVAALLYILVSGQQQVQPAGPTANAGMPGAPAAGGRDKELGELMTVLEKNPQDVPTLLKMAHLLLKDQMFSEAKVVNERALKLQPDSLEGKVHDAMLHAAEGQGDQAKAMLAEVVRQDPKFAEAWFFRGMLAMQGGDQATMRESFKQFVAVAPAGPQRDRVQRMLDAQP